MATEEMATLDSLAARPGPLPMAVMPAGSPAIYTPPLAIPAPQPVTPADILRGPITNMVRPFELDAMPTKAEITLAHGVAIMKMDHLPNLVARIIFSADSPLILTTPW